MIKLRFLVPSVLLVILGALGWGWSHSANHEPRLLATANSGLLSLASSSAGMGKPELSESARSSSTLELDEPDFARHVRELNARIKKTLPAAEAAAFSIIIQKPFVVVGDEPTEDVQRHADNTVKWAVDRLKQDFFTKDPNEILDIWLFKDEASYTKHTQLFFGDTPSTPYGYYSPAHKALIMNIGTGGGTLVHEIVHPFMEANFPACPPWLNEGLGSLYEQCGDVDRHIHGFTNWRLPGLQRAINAKRVPSFKALTEMNRQAFYNDDRGTNYAQARYLCYYLQEKKLLVKFYQEFLKQQKQDPSGYQTLRKILGEPNMVVFKSRWEKYVLGLRQGTQ